MAKIRVREGTTLDGAIAEAGLTLVDIGARGHPAAAMRRLARYSTIVACEPDAEEADRVAADMRATGLWKNVVVVTEAIASEGTEATLHLTSRPGMSSLLRPDPAVAGRFALHESFVEIGTTTVPTITLDRAAERYQFQDAAYLKIDTQGTELDILRSGDRLVSDAILGVHVEAEFHPFYSGQPLFADVDTFLRERGFWLLDLRRTLLRSNDHRPEIYSRRQVAWAHCLYLRDPAQLIRGDRDETIRRALRWLAIAITYEYFDLAFALLASETGAALRDRYPGIDADLENAAVSTTRKRLQDRPEAEHEATLAIAAKD